MNFNHQAGGDMTTGGSWLNLPGTYHFSIVGVDDQPSKRDGSPINNAAFRIDLGVIDGTTPNQADKTADIIFFYGKPGEEKSEAFAKKKMDRLFVAAGVMTPQQVEAKESVDIDLETMIGRQIVAKFELEEDKTGKERLGLSFAEIYHVDDPAVKDVPKDADYLRLIDAKLRWPGGQPQAATTSALQPQSAAQPAAGDWVDSL